MGTVFSQKQPIDSASTIRDVFGALSPRADTLRGMLEKDRFWLLNRRRNLILHRRAVVDETYLSNTGDRVELGSRLEIDVTDIQTDLELVRDTGMSSSEPFQALLELSSLNWSMESILRGSMFLQFGSFYMLAYRPSRLTVTRHNRRDFLDAHWRDTLVSHLVLYGPGRSRSWQPAHRLLRGGPVLRRLKPSPDWWAISRAAMSLGLHRGHRRADLQEATTCRTLRIEPPTKLPTAL